MIVASAITFPWFRIVNVAVPPPRFTASSGTLGAIIASSANSHRNDRYADRGWSWRDGYYWDRQGRRYDRDGRPCDDDGYYDRRGYNDRSYSDRGWGRGWDRDDRQQYGRGDSDRGTYGRDESYGDRRYRYGN